MMNSYRWYSVVVSIICILVLPGLAATAYWAFFSQQTLLGVGLLLAANIPLGLSFVLDTIHAR
jgi:hypothetical protein